MIWLDGGKDHHTKLAFHKEQVSENNVGKEHGGEMGGGADGMV